jgi:hypothetical protein
MKVFIEVNVDNAAFEDNLAEELRRILNTVPLKVYEQLDRGIGTLRVTPSKLFELNGNSVGSVAVLFKQQEFSKAVLRARLEGRKEALELVEQDKEGGE